MKHVLRFLNFINPKKYSDYIKLLIFMICIFFGLIVFVTSIPRSWIEYNANASLQVLKNEGFGQYSNTLQRNDGFSDGISISQALNISGDSMNNIKAAMDNSFYRVDTNEVTPYTRFWHGYLVYLKPLLIFFNIHVIRQIQIIVFMFLFLILAFLLAQKISKSVAIAFIISIGVVSPANIMTNMIYISTFYVMFLSSIITLLLLEKKKPLKYHLMNFMFIGGLTNYFDYFTTPIITWGVPLLIYLAYLINNSKKIKDYKSIVLSSIYLSASWFIGYVLIWVSKWSLASIILHRNVFKTALSQASQYLEPGDTINYAYTIFDTFYNNLKYSLMFSPIVICLLILIILLIIYLIYKRNFNKVDATITALLFLVSIAPFIWMGLTNFHAFAHHWMVYRELIISIFGIILLFIYLTKKLLRNKKLLYRFSSNSFL